MTAIKPELVEIRSGLTDRVRRARRVFARASRWPLAVRLGVYLAALTAEAFAYPPTLLFGVPTVFLLLFALLPALAPRSPAVTGFWLLTALAWLGTTTTYDGTATLPRLIGVAAGLYLVHSGAALAAVLPYDAVVSPSVPVRWMLRAILILAVSLGLAVYGVYQSLRLGEHSYLAATVIGLALTVALAWLLAAVIARRR